MQYDESPQQMLLGRTIHDNKEAKASTSLRYLEGSKQHDKDRRSNCSFPMFSLRVL